MKKTVAYFTAGYRGKRERGEYYFWTAESKHGSTSGRALTHLPKEERFERLKGELPRTKRGEVRAAYRRHWKIIHSIKRIRASTPYEVARWLASHKEDAVFLKRLEFK